MGNIWYHGTLDQGIKQFKTLSHFGNKFSACAAAARHNFLYENNKPRFLYEVEIKLLDSEILTVLDWGKNDPIALCNTLREYFEPIDKNLEYVFNEIRLEGFELKKGNQVYKDLLNDKVSKELSKMGYKALSYLNDVERENSDEISLCVIDTSIISIQNISSFTPEENNEATAFIQNLYKRITTIVRKN